MRATRALRSAVCGTFLLAALLAPAGARLGIVFAALLQEKPPVNVAAKSSARSAEEQLFFRGANAERVARGLPAYQWDETLAAAARKHAALMAKMDELSHRLAGEAPLDERAALEGARFSSVGENVAIGYDPPAIQNGWMNSPGHRANILDARFTALGVGVVEVEGQFYAVEDFSTAVEELTREQQEDKVAALLKARGFHVLDDRTEARKFCDEHFVPAHPTKMAILRLETPDVGSISEDLERSLRGQKYRRAEVGACPSVSSEKGIMRFRLSLLFYPDAQPPQTR